MYIDHPYRFDSRRRTKLTSEEDHIRDMIEQVLFTNPGERVQRPEFGCGLLQLVFAGNSDELATATQFLAQAALQKYLGDRIQLESVQVTALDSTLLVQVNYELRTTGERVSQKFQRPL